MRNATFYIIAEGSTKAERQGLLQYVVFLSQHFSKQGAKIFINSQNKQEAETLAELFWQVPTNLFIAHNLVGEGPRYSTPIEIGYPEVRPNINRQIVINLSDCNTTFAHRFSEVVDFVPCEEQTKQLARERYKLYRQAGFQLQTLKVNDSD
ncbi:DNA polymerase III subunit chi [Vibrio salinus]|uniref:DNA polymerase III subunit chi n=1 Tax=Vibrio salinus TaxID=2899784 RepID=UPI001E589250|nr:DNA polymerase III subunit chi [Vibrio salinus]MCE0494079.1 DNA polymerase III subunit chi [Vibrio salinus]